MYSACIYICIYIFFYYSLYFCAPLHLHGLPSSVPVLACLSRLYLQAYLTNLTCLQLQLSLLRTPAISRTYRPPSRYQRQIDLSLRDLSKLPQIDTLKRLASTNAHEIGSDQQINTAHPLQEVSQSFSNPSSANLQLQTLIHHQTQASSLLTNNHAKSKFLQPEE